MIKDRELYIKNIEQGLGSLYKIAEEARRRGLDPSLKPEPYFAKDLAERVEGLVGPQRIAERIRELSNRMGPHEMAFVIASDIVDAKFGHVKKEEASEQAIRTALAIMTGGITAAPIQGIVKVRIKQNADRTQYLAIYFAGPIRSAAGTEQALTPVIGDFVRRRLGLARYKPTENEVNRFVEEVRLYEREVRKFQYHVSDESLAEALRHLPVEMTGTESDPYEVSTFRNLPRVETNRIRGGALLVVNDGIVGRSQKVWRIIEALNIEGWNWLKKVKKTGQDTKKRDKYLYMEDIIAGRPIFSFPSAVGGFRLRYGRSRNTGLSALGIHPLTMAVLHNFLASGTQIRIEGPGKGGVVLPVDSIETPIVRLRDGSVVKIDKVSQAEELKSEIESILFLGDLLVGFGEFFENNKNLLPSGYVEEWWVQEVRKRIQEYDEPFKCGSEISGLSLKRFISLVSEPLITKPTAREAIILARNLNVPLHPNYTYFWEEITLEELYSLREALNRSEKKIECGIIIDVRLTAEKTIKEILERLCVPHKVEGEEIILSSDGLILSVCLQIDKPDLPISRKQNVIDTIKLWSGITLREKGGTYIGARMGRPEKAKERKMSPLVHGLFPVGLQGGSRRNVTEAAKKGLIQVEILRRRCSECGQITYKLTCPTCHTQTLVEKTCPRCQAIINDETCPACKIKTVEYDRRLINMLDIYDDACRCLGLKKVDLVKGVKGMTSATKTPEPLEKGVLRAKYGLSVYKDGTVRFDCTDAPLTHFKPFEIGTSIEELRTLGYNHDRYIKSLSDPGQICELKVQDVLLPRSCADYLISVTKFIDELLEKFYRLPPFFKVHKEGDLIGHLVMGFAPHTSAGVVGRIIGFTNMYICYAHPLWHNIKRRDCDGDEDSIMLVLDVLLNFSKAYLPARIGGMMDAPLLLISTVDPFEVDEAQHLDVASFYPLNFYEQTLKGADPKIIGEVIDLVEHRLGTPAQFERYSFTHPTFNINDGNHKSAYTRIRSMSKKLEMQLLLADKIKAVDSKEVARRVLTTHLLRDIAGNLRAYTRQRFRCKRCNAKFRRIPLSGKCLNCGADLMVTVHKKSIEKYLDIADDLVVKYDVGLYYRQRLSLIRDEINSIFIEPKAERIKQVTLSEFM